MSEHTYGPSEPAAAAAQDVEWRQEGHMTQTLLDALDAAHDPALGLDASICKRDVVALLRSRVAPPGATGGLPAADWLEREWGGDDAR